MAVRDFVFPLGLFEPDGDKFKLVDFLGSAFLIGNRGYALTAAHVLPHDGTIGGMFVNAENEWRIFILTRSEKHPTEDVAIFQLQKGTWRTPFRCRNKWEGQGSPYKQFGYPKDAVWEMKGEDGRVLPRPDMVYVQGYIRRQFSLGLEIEGIKGTQFFEVSQQAGMGCSGSPLFIGNGAAWDVIGIYSAEITKNEVPVAYAVREEAFRDWKPEILEGTPVLAESQNIDGTVN